MSDRLHVEVGHDYRGVGRLGFGEEVGGLQELARARRAERGDRAQQRARLRGPNPWSSQVNPLCQCNLHRVLTAQTGGLQENGSDLGGFGPMFRLAAW